MHRTFGWSSKCSPPNAPTVSQKQRLSPSSHFKKGGSSHAGDKPVLNRIFLLPNFSNCFSCSNTVFLLRQQKSTSLYLSRSSRVRKRYPFDLAHSFSLRAK